MNPLHYDSVAEKEPSFIPICRYYNMCFTVRNLGLQHVPWSLYIYSDIIVFRLIRITIRFLLVDIALNMQAAR